MKKYRNISVFLFLVTFVAGFLGFGVKTVLAASCKCTTGHVFVPSELKLETDESTREACIATCKTVAGSDSYMFDTDSAPLFWGTDVLSNAVNAATNTRVVASDPMKALGGLFLIAINGILYAILSFIALLFGLSATIFGWATDSRAWLQLFNMPATYTMWGMIRDFFNLFFILTLLFVAFGTIFQIQAYHYKKWLLHIVLMALLVNFSFPVARFIVDATNVPMYFFIDSILGDGQGNSTGVFEAFLGGSKLNEMMFPPVTDGILATFSNIQTTGRLIQAIVFVFILAASLLILALLFLVRLVALLLLVIFSPVGFAASAIPGFEKFSKQWWDYFMKYALFGPAAMLMILMSITFLNNFKVGANSTRVDLVSEYTKGITSSSDQATLITSMVVTIIPVILIWFSMSVGNSFGIAGAGVLTSFAQKQLKTLGKKVTGYTDGKRRADAYLGERKKLRDDRFSRNNIGTRLGQHRNLVSERKASESRFKTEAGRKLAASGALTREQELAKEEAKRRAINSNTSKTELQRQHAEAVSRKDGLQMKVVMDEVAKRPELQGMLTNADMKLVEERFKDRGGMDNAAMKETKDSVAKVNLKAAYGTGSAAKEKMRDAFKFGKVKIEDQTANALNADVLDAALETNKLNQKIVDELSKSDPDKAINLKANLDQAITDFEGGFNARMIAAGGSTTPQGKILTKQRTNAHQTYFSREGKFHSTATLNPGDSFVDMGKKTLLQNAVFKKADAMTLQDIDTSDPTRFKGHIKQITANTPTGRIATIISNIAEEDMGKASAMITEIKANAAPWTLPGPNSDEVKKAHEIMTILKRDARTRELDVVKMP